MEELKDEAGRQTSAQSGAGLCSFPASQCSDPQSSIICLITGVKAQRQSCEAAGPSLSFKKSVLDADAVISSGLDEAMCCSSEAPLL